METFMPGRKRSVRPRRDAMFTNLNTLQAPVAPVVERPINEAVRPCLIQVAYLGYRERKPPPDVAYSHARDHLNRAKARIEALALSPEDKADIFYALVAFTDEIMQMDPGPLKEFWQAHLLQLEYFGETRAGEGFFERLERLKMEGRLGVLRVYHLCLLFGFHGIYASHGELERENLMDGLRVLLDRTRSKRQTTLSPRGERPDEPGAERERNLMLQWLAAASAAMAVVWYVGILFTVDAQERSLAESLERAYQDLKLGVVASSP